MIQPTLEGFGRMVLYNKIALVVANTAKLTWAASDRVTLKLRTAAGVVALNSDFENPGQLLPANGPDVFFKTTQHL